MTLEQLEGEEHIKVDKKDENRVIAYIQALSQAVLNIVSGDT